MGLFFLFPTFIKITAQGRNLFMKKVKKLLTYMKQLGFINLKRHFENDCF